jgi:hypothetical protein
MTPPGSWNSGPWNSFLWNQVAEGGAAQGALPPPPSVIPILYGQIIPLTNSPQQSLQVTLSIDGGTVTLNLIVSFNEVGGFWVMQIFDPAGGVILSDVPLVTGSWPAANVLSPFVYMSIGSAYVINNGGIGDWPGITGWGLGGFLLLWSDTPAS